MCMRPKGQPYNNSDIQNVTTQHNKDSTGDKVEQKQISIIEQEKPIAPIIINQINKIGFDHQQGISDEEDQVGICQNQDYFLISYNPDPNSIVKSIKMVLDGCGGQPNSGVGAQLFAQLFNKIPDDKKFNYNLFEHNVCGVIETIIKMFGNSYSLICDNLFHTILCVFELEDKFLVKVAGDGYIILCKENDVEYLEQDDGEYAKYYLYNFLPNNCRGAYTDGIPFKTLMYSKNDYRRVGVATDGFRFALTLLAEEQLKLKRNLLNGNFAQIHMLINRNYKEFHDDITICL